MQEFRLNGLTVIGSSFDGDARARSLLMLCLRDANEGAPPEAVRKLEHPLVELHAVYPHPGRETILLFFPDWLHIVFRLRRQMLEAKRRLDIGGMLVTLLPLTELARDSSHPLSTSALDFADKQNFEGKQRF